MPCDRKPSLIVPVAVALAVLLAGYVAAYYVMVEPSSSTNALTRTTRKFPEYPPVAEYWVEAHEWNPVAFDRWSRFFAPIHWLDRRIRPHVWESEE